MNSLRRLAALVALALLLAACAGDDGSPTSGDTDGEAAQATDTQGGTTADGAAAAPPVQIHGRVNDHGTVQAPVDGRLTVIARDFFFEPTYVQTAPGASVPLTITNEGTTAHTFTIDELDIDETLAPGDSVEVEAQFPQQGPITYYCRFHMGQGMQGAFFFEADGQNATDGSTGTGGGQDEDDGY